MAYIVCNAAGLITQDYSLPYVATWANGDIDVLRSTADRVLGAARRALIAAGLAEAPDEVAA